MRSRTRKWTAPLIRYVYRKLYKVSFGLMRASKLSLIPQEISAHSYTRKKQAARNQWPARQFWLIL
jgi:hypothetical protein